MRYLLLAALLFLLPLPAQALEIPQNPAVEVRIKTETLTPTQVEIVIALVKEVFTDFPEMALSVSISGGGERSHIYATTFFLYQDSSIHIVLYDLFWEMSWGGKRSALGHELQHAMDFRGGVWGPRACQKINAEIRALEWEKQNFPINKPTIEEVLEVHGWLLEHYEEKLLFRCLW